MSPPCRNPGWTGASAIESPDWTDLLTNEFPNLYSEGFQTVAEPTERYNCMGYAADDTSRWWWPDGTNYWPPWAT